MHATSIAWVGPYPGHYLRSVHRKVEIRYPGVLTFFYILPQNEDQALRGYEVGGLPENSVVLHEKFPFSASMHVWRELQRVQPKVVISFGQYPRSMVAAAAWVFTHDVLGCYYTDTNLYDVLKKPAWWRWLKRLINGTYLRQLWRVLVLGEMNRAFLVWCAGGERLPKQIRMPYGHEAEFFRNNTAPDLAANYASFTVLSLCRLVPQKAVHHIVEAMALLAPDVRKACTLLVVGDGPERGRLEALAAKLDLGETVQFAGAVPSDRVPEYFSRANAFVLASTYEPWALVVNEAMSSGLPVICPYWIGAAADLVHTGITGVRLENGSPAAIAGAITALYGDRKRTAQMGINGRELIRTGGWNDDGALEAWDVLMNEVEVTIRQRK